MWLTLAGMAASAIANGIATRRANRINQKNYEEVRNYNRPSAQMARFRAAGLNPNLIYTQSNEADSRPEWNAPQFDFNSFGASASSELQGYQNIKESKSRVDNLVKQNRLLDEQILGLTIENRFKEDLTKAQIKLLYKQIEQIDKSIDNIDFEQDFKNRSLNNDTIKALWNFAIQYATLGLHGEELKLKREQFSEQIRQFNIQNRGRVLIDELLKHITGTTNARDAATVIAKMLAEIVLSGFSS